jgi:hypothetical protein
MKWMITCKEATNMISKKEEGKISLPGYLRLWFHLSICKMCSLFNKQNKLIIKQAGKLHQHIHDELSTQDKQAIINQLENSTS